MHVSIFICITDYIRQISNTRNTYMRKSSEIADDPGELNPEIKCPDVGIDYSAIVIDFYSRVH